MPYIGQHPVDPNQGLDCRPNWGVEWGPRLPVVGPGAVLKRGLLWMVLGVRDRSGSPLALPGPPSTEHASMVNPSLPGLLLVSEPVPVALADVWADVPGWA